VIRNDQIQLDVIEKYDKILLSPGPGLPKNAGLTMKVIENYYQTKPILGVCLGHQAIAEFFGATLFNLKKVMHGKESKVKITDFNDYLLKGIHQNFIVGRYHSWAVNRNSLEKTQLLITSETKEGQIMSLKHNLFDIRCVQFHPESIMTKQGKKMIKNWVKN